MPPSSYPTTLADLRYHFSTTSIGDKTNSDPFQGQDSIYTTLRHLRRATLGTSSRLRSIYLDSQYITRHIHHEYPSFPLVANERCGSWYIPPTLKGGSVYFKSTDGHQGYWRFSLRRLNLHLCDVLGQMGGAVVVDSTRRGKMMSDALRWTVPVWVAVVNRVCFPGRSEWSGLQVLWSGGAEGAGGVGGENEETSVQRTVEEIEERLVGFVGDFQRLGVDVEDLRTRLQRPIKIVWEVNGVESDSREEEWHDGDDAKTKQTNLLVLCSASRLVKGAEISQCGYVQGAADDSEGWSHGLTPELFWKHHEKLLSTPEDGLPDVVSRLLQDQTVCTGKAVLIAPTANIFIASDQKGHTVFGQDFDLVVNCSQNESTASARIVNLACPVGKAGSNALRKKLSVVRSLVADILRRSSTTNILLTCATGRDLSIGVALVVLCCFFDETGQVQMVPKPQNTVDKMLVTRRLVWISSSKPDVQPSRSTLQAVNAVLMGPR